MRERLPAGHPVRLVIEAVRLLDTSAFHAGRKTGGAGAAGFDPDMLVTLLVRAYANGITSSRRIERLCGQDVAFRVIRAGRVPDHVTVARFRQRFAGTAAALFAEVLVLCARLGTGRAGTVALDGTKIAAGASGDANRTEAGLRKLAEEMAARHVAADAGEDALSGGGERGDDDPGGPFTRRERAAAALASPEREREAREAAERAAAREHLKAAQAGAVAPRGRPPAGAGAETARAALERETAACLARIAERERLKAAGDSTRRRPVPPGQPSLVRRAQERPDKALARDAARQAAAAKKEKEAPAVRNVTGPGSRLMPVRGGGFTQGYNAQNVASENGPLIATRLTDGTAGTRWYEPVTSDATAAAAGTDGTAGLVLADAGYLSEANPTCPGPDRLIATGKRRDPGKAARTASGSDTQGEEGATAAAAMAARLRTPEDITARRQRGPIAETPHGRIKHNTGIRRLAMRGMRKAPGEWQLACAARNLMTAITSGHLTPQALASLAR